MMLRKCAVFFNKSVFTNAYGTLKSKAKKVKVAGKELKFYIFF